MSRLGTQRALTHIYFNEKLRDRIRLGDISGLESFDLTSNQICQIHTFVCENWSKISRLSKLLIHKKSERLGRWFPLTARSLNPDVWLSYCDNYTREHIGTSSDEIVDFAAYLRSRIGPVGSERFELLTLEYTFFTLERMAIARRPVQIALKYSSRPVRLPHVVLYEAAFHPNALREWAVRGGQKSLSRSSLCLLLFRHSTDTSGVELRVISPVVSELLQCCNGKTELAHILRRVLPSRLEEGLAVLNEYLRAGVVENLLLREES